MLTICDNDHSREGVMYKVTRLLLNGFMVSVLVALGFVFASLVVAAPSTDRVVYIFDSAVEDIEHLS